MAGSPIPVGEILLRWMVLAFLAIGIWAVTLLLLARALGPRPRGRSLLDRFNIALAVAAVAGGIVLALLWRSWNFTF